MGHLRFCFLTTFYPPYNFGGDGIGIQRFARGLVNAGHRVTVVLDADAYNSLSPNKNPSFAGREDDGVEVVPLRSGLGVVSNLLTQQTGRPVINGPQIRRLLERGNYDVVNFHNASLVGGPGLFSYGRDSVRLYMAHEHWLVCPTHVLWRYGKERCDAKECLRCMVSYRRPPQLYRYNGYMDKQLAEVDAFIAMSQFSKNKHREFGFAHDMEVVNYFLPDPDGSERQAPPQERPYFLFVGRLEKIKGLDDVIPLFRRYPQADLLIAGDGQYRAHLEELARGLDNVKFLGRVSQDVLRAYYENTVALIVPSICYETFGIILIEAFRYGVPVVARRLGPFPEIVETSGGGELFETEDELVAALERLAGDREHRDRCADAGHRAFLERWTESAVIPKYLDVVRRTALRTGRSGVAQTIDQGVTQ